MSINSALGTGRKIWGGLQGAKRYTMKATSGSGATATFTGQPSIVQHIKKGYRGTGLNFKASVLSVNYTTGVITVATGSGTFYTGATYIFTS